MQSNSSIHIKVELKKNPNTNIIELIAHLNPMAPNITNNSDDISWEPTLEEREFIVDTFTLVKKQNINPDLTFKRNVQELNEEDSTKELNYENQKENEDYIENTIEETIGKHVIKNNNINEKTINE
jgi:hypothetical protein